MLQDLVDGLVQLGVDAKCTLGTGCPPVEVKAAGLPSGKVSQNKVKEVVMVWSLAAPPVEVKAAGLPSGRVSQIQRCVN